MYFYFVKTTVESSSSIRFEFKKFVNKTSVVDHATKYVTSIRLSVSEHPPPLIAEVGNQNNVSKTVEQELSVLNLSYPMVNCFLLLRVQQS